MKMHQIIAAFLLAFLVLPALAQEEDGSGDSADPQCVVSTNWRVALNELPDAAGMAMDVNKRDG